MNQLLFTRREGRLIFYAWVVFCLVYAYELAHFNLSIDDELMAFSQACNFSVIGRWLHTLVRKTLWLQVVVPTGPLLIFGAALALAFVFILRVFAIVPFRAGHLLTFAAFALFPTWMAQMEFVGNLIPVGVGLVCAVLAAWVMLGPLAARGIQWPLPVRMLLAVVLVAVAVGAYQSLPLLTLALLLAGSLRAVAQAEAAKRTFWQMAAAGAAVVVAGSLLSLGIAKLDMMACGLGAHDYAKSFFDPGAFWRDPVGMLRVVVKDAGHQVWGHWKAFGVSRVVFTLAIVLSAAVCVRAAAPGRRWLVLLGLCLIFLVPTGFDWVTGAPLPIRTYFATAGVMCSFLLMAYVMAPRPWVRTLVAALALLVAVQGLYIHSIQQARGWMVRQHDARLAAGIYNEVMRQSGQSDEQAVHLNIRGRKPFHSNLYPAVPSTTHGASFFEWDNGYQVRMVAYMRMQGYENVREYREQFAGQFDEAYARMPAWPLPGSVKQVDGVFLVKLSQP